MSNIKSKRFVIRKSLIGKNQIIEVTFKNGKGWGRENKVEFPGKKRKKK